jgi:DinB superfamily
MITPDTKDWTWVLERRCPECGFDAAGFEREQVGSMIRTTAAAWRGVLDGPAVAERPSSDVWSPLEYSCHVRDVFRIYDERLRRMLTEDDPQYANWDQDATAVDDLYAEQDAGRVASELKSAAARLADRFDGVAGEQWNRRGTRSDGAHFTVESFARYLIHDPIHHLFDVGDRWAQGTMR